MSRINPPITIGPGDPLYYAELLRKTTRSVDRRLPYKKHPCPDVASIIGDVDGPLIQRLQCLLDMIASISLCRRRNVSAATASIVHSGDTRHTLKMHLYIIFNHQNDGAAGRCTPHLKAIFKMLHEIPTKSHAIDGSPIAIAPEFHTNLVKISRVIHNYSFSIFAYHVNKREHKLSYIRKCIERDQKHFEPEQRATLVTFLDHVKMIIEIVKTNTQLSTSTMSALIGVYSTWTDLNILPKDDDSAVGEAKTLLDTADIWLAKEHDIHFQLSRWAEKIMSFVIIANRLLLLTQSCRLRKLLDGGFSVTVLPSPTTTPYSCRLSSEAIEETLDAALDGTSYRSAEWEEARKLFTQRLLEEPEASKSKVVCWRPTLHAELALLLAMVKDKVNVLPYIGVSKLSCLMCCNYIRAFNKVMRQNISTKGSHGKVYPGWFMPRLPHSDGKLRQALLGYLKDQLLSDFKKYASSEAETRELSDSSVGSGRPRMGLPLNLGYVSKMLKNVTKRQQ